MAVSCADGAISIVEWEIMLHVAIGIGRKRKKVWPRRCLNRGGPEIQSYPPNPLLPALLPSDSPVRSYIGFGGGVCTEEGEKERQELGVGIDLHLPPRLILIWRGGDRILGWQIARVAGLCRVA